MLDPKRKQSNRNSQDLYEIFDRNFTNALEILKLTMQTVEDNKKELA